ncbi:MAG: GAF domain-containing protein [Anaerolineales bacterium]
MNDPQKTPAEPRVLVLADVASNAKSIIQRTLEPAGIQAWPESDSTAPPPDVVVVDVTQLRGDPLASLRNLRSQGNEAPAIVLAAHFPTARLRDLFRLGVADIMLKPYKAIDLCKAIIEVGEARSEEVTTQLLVRRLQSTREQARRRSEEIRWLSEIGRTVVRLRDLDDILARVVEAAAFLTGAEEANIYLVEKKTREIVLRASKTTSTTVGALNRLRINDTLAGQVYRTGRPVVRQPETRGDQVKVQTGFLVQSLIMIPIQMADQVVGVLGVYNQSAARNFSDHHVTLLKALADWAGVALEQAISLARQEGEELPVPSDMPATEEAPPTPEPKLSEMPSSVVQGLEETNEKLRRLLNQSIDQLDPQSRTHLQEISRMLDYMTTLPMAVVEPDPSAPFTDLKEITAQVVEELTLAARQRNLELDYSSEENIPLLRVERDRVHRLIEALTASALRRTKRGSVSLELQRFSVVDGQGLDLNLPLDHNLEDGLWVAIRVSDSSGGLSPDTIRALSTPEPDPATGHIGPGLSMGEIRLIAESMGGRMWHEHSSAAATIALALPAR